MSWAPATFDTASRFGPVPRSGYVYRGLGLDMRLKGSPKGRRKPTWVLTHLGSGHALAEIKGVVAEAFPIATEIAEAGDWEFDSLWGWKDRFPDAPTKTLEIIGRYENASREGGSIGSGMNEDVAREIAMRRV